MLMKHTSVYKITLVYLEKRKKEKKKKREKITLLASFALLAPNPQIYLQS